MIANACSEAMKYTMSTKDQTLMIDGFAHCLEGTVFLCTNGISPKDGDLVVRMCGKQPVLYIFRPDSSEEFEGRKRVLNDAHEVDAVVACSFNFYQ